MDRFYHVCHRTQPRKGDGINAVMYLGTAAHGRSVGSRAQASMLPGCLGDGSRGCSADSDVQQHGQVDGAMQADGDSSMGSLFSLG